jgi:hypothetical protein
MVLVSKLITKEWPGRLAYLVVRGLMKKFVLIDTISKIKIRQKLNQITMKMVSDPAILFDQLSAIEGKCLAPGNKIEEADMITILLDVAPKNINWY